MHLVRLSRSSRQSERRSDTPIVALWIALSFLHPAHAAGPFSTFWKEKTFIQSVGHDGAGNLYVFEAHTLSRLDPSASRVDWAVDTTGHGCDAGAVMAVNSAGESYIAGAQTTPCVLKYDASGKLVSAFVIERTVNAGPKAMAIDADGTVIITGLALAPGFPVTQGAFSSPDSTLGSGSTLLQPFIVRIDAAASKVLTSAIGVGGSSLAIGPRGDVFVSGDAAGFGVGSGPFNTYPITAGAFQTTFTPALACGFPCQIALPAPEQYVTRLDYGLTKLIYSTWVSGGGGAVNAALAVDSEGNAYVTGTTESTDYPYSANQPGFPRAHTFLTKLDPTGSRLVWSVQQGGSRLAFDGNGNVILASAIYPAAGLPSQQFTDFPAPPRLDGVPDPCKPTGLRVQVGTAIEGVSSVDGNVLASQFLAATYTQPSAMDVLPDGRILVGGYSTFPDIPIAPGTLFTSAISQRTPYGVFLAAFDLASPALGGQLACAADGLTNMPLGPVSAGQWISLFGAGFSNGSVTFDGVAAPVTYQTDGQINLSVPWEILGKSSTLMQVSVDGAVIASRQFSVAASNPSVFLDSSGTAADNSGSYFAAIALNEDGSRNSQDNPAAGGSFVTLFLNGVSAYDGSTPPLTGATTPDNPVPLNTPVTVTAGTLTLESGPLTPRAGVLTGLYQVRARMSSDVRSVALAVALTVTVGGVPAGPFVYFNQVYQAGAFVWVK